MMQILLTLVTLKIAECRLSYLGEILLLNLKLLVLDIYTCLIDILLLFDLLKL